MNKQIVPVQDQFQSTKSQGGKRMACICFASLASVLMFGTSAFAGGIIVDSDEWTLSDAGFGAEGAANGTRYADNAAAFLTGGSGSILIYSDNFGLNGAGLNTALTGAGYSLTYLNPNATAFGSVNLSAYRAIFMAGDSLPAGYNTALTSYVNNGGGVYIAAGTGDISGGAAGEAAQWNSFLNPFGLNLATSYNGVNGAFATSGAGPVLSGVSDLFYDNGNNVNALGGFPDAQVITSLGANGLIGTVAPSGVPDSTPTFVLLGAGMVSLALGRRVVRAKA